MSQELKVGDVVNNKADKKIKYTISQIDIDNINAICVDSKGSQTKIPLIALEKFEEPQGPAIKSASSRW